MEQPVPTFRIEPFRSGELAAAVCAALHAAIGSADVEVLVIADVEGVWADAAAAVGFRVANASPGTPSTGSASADRLVLVCSPVVESPGAIVEAHVAQSSAVVLPILGCLTSSDGGTPGYAQRFAVHGWRFSDVIRPALWADERFGPDAKEGWLCFAAPGRLAALGASPPTQVVHPDRFEESERIRNLELEELRKQFLEKVRPLAHRRELDVARQALAELRETLEAQRQQFAAVEARVAANERRLVLLMEQQLGLGGPLVAVADTGPPGRRSWRRKVADFVTAQPPRRVAPVATAELSPAVVALFDAGAYVAEHPDAAVYPLTHYLTKGEALGFRPNPWFDPLFYRERYPDVARAGVSPLIHFADYGGAEGRAASAEFDTQWYVASYPEVRSSGLNPLLHYLAVGAALGYRTRAQALPGEGGTP